MLSRLPCNRTPLPLQHKVTGPRFITSLGSQCSLQHSLVPKHGSCHSEVRVCALAWIVCASVFERSEPRFERKLHLAWKNYLCSYFKHLATPASTSEYRLSCRFYNCSYFLHFLFRTDSAGTIVTFIIKAVVTGVFSSAMLA